MFYSTLSDLVLWKTLHFIKKRYHQKWQKSQNHHHTGIFQEQKRDALEGCIERWHSHDSSVHDRTSQVKKSIRPSSPGNGPWYAMVTGTPADVWPSARQTLTKMVGSRCNMCKSAFPKWTSQKIWWPQNIVLAKNIVNTHQEKKWQKCTFSLFCLIIFLGGHRLSHHFFWGGTSQVHPQFIMIHHGVPSHNSRPLDLGYSQAEVFLDHMNLKEDARSFNGAGCHWTTGKVLSDG